jgi:hypothetical protein
MRKTLIILTLTISALSCKKPDGKTSGVVTYYFNKNFGDKPDVGAKIYIVGKEAFDTMKSKLIGRYIQVQDLVNSINKYKNIIANDSETNSLTVKYGLKQDTASNKTVLFIREEMEESKSALIALNINSKQEFDSLDNQAYRDCVVFRNLKNIKETTADGNGAYSVSLRPGSYYTLIVSNHRKGHAMAEFTGKIHFSSINIESEKETSVSPNFTAD